MTDPNETQPIDPGEIRQPGLTSELHERPDHGEQSYVGAGRLRGRRAFITGGDSGIGRAVAIAFAREGADVAIVYLPVEEDDAHETAKWVQEAGQRVELIPADLTSEEAAVEAVRRGSTALGGLDLLVLNAAYQRARDSLEFDSAEFDRVLKTNLYATFWVVREAVSALPAGASILVTSSIQAEHPSPDLIDYAMTKAALVAFVEAAAARLGPRGIRVNAVAPGPIWTPLIPATGWTDKLEHFGEDTPLGRVGQPAEVAPAFVFLASEAASYISGTVLPVTGGKKY
ncbi:MAG TPA: SDR family oxidoreductase [Microbacteriaceae bacterium]|nr:SDR family oxidoreductase [Microbacteriaceae bacterium]